MKYKYIPSKADVRTYNGKRQCKLHLNVSEDVRCRLSYSRSYNRPIDRQFLRHKLFEAGRIALPRTSCKRHHHIDISTSPPTKKYTKKGTHLHNPESSVTNLAFRLTSANRSNAHTSSICNTYNNNSSGNLAIGIDSASSSGKNSNGGDHSAIKGWRRICGLLRARASSRCLRPSMRW